jgi:hypothetical protein
VTNCADFYVAFSSNAFVLVGHDFDTNPIRSINWEEQGGRTKVSLVRRPENSSTRTGYSYHFRDDFTLLRDLSTFISN